MAHLKNTSSFFLLKMDHSGHLFLYFRLFNSVDSKQMFNINNADDWIQTSDLWYRKWRFSQVSNNHHHFFSLWAAFTY